MRANLSDRGQRSELRPTGDPRPFPSVLIMGEGIKTSQGVGLRMLWGRSAVRCCLLDRCDDGYTHKLIAAVAMPLTEERTGSGWLLKGGRIAFLWGGGVATGRYLI